MTSWTPPRGVKRIIAISFCSVTLLSSATAIEGCSLKSGRIPEEKEKGNMISRGKATLCKLSACEAYDIKTARCALTSPRLCQYPMSILLSENFDKIS